jgi:hypothetical protein
MDGWLLAQANGAEEIILNEIACYEDAEEKVRALRAWNRIPSSRTLTASAA